MNIAPSQMPPGCIATPATGFGCVIEIWSHLEYGATGVPILQRRPLPSVERANESALAGALSQVEYERDVSGGLVKTPAMAAGGGKVTGGGDITGDGGGDGGGDGR
jgi:hypothetical protein